jgi:toxin ParE1/3/4
MVGASSAPIWSSEAQADLSDIWNYYAQVAGRRIADNIVRGIVNATRLLEDHPYGGRSRDEVRPGLRSVVANPHVIFYRVTADQVAQIVRVLDGRRDIDAIFDEPDGSQSG